MVDLASNRVTLAAGAAAGALAAGVYAYKDTGSTSWSRLLTFSGIGGVAGAGATYGALHARDAASASGKPNYAVIFGATGLSLAVLHGLLTKKSSATVIKNGALGSIGAGALGWGITALQRQV